VVKKAERAKQKRQVININGIDFMVDEHVPLPTIKVK